MLVEHDPVNHLRRGRARRVPDFEVPSISTISPPPLAVRSTIAWIRSSGTEGTAATPTLVAETTNHRDCWAPREAPTYRGHVLHRRARLPRDEGREAGGVEDPGHPEDARSFGQPETFFATWPTSRVGKQIQRPRSAARPDLGHDLLGHHRPTIFSR